MIIFAILKILQNTHDMIIDKLLPISVLKTEFLKKNSEVSNQYLQLCGHIYTHKSSNIYFLAHVDIDKQLLLSNL